MRRRILYKLLSGISQLTSVSSRSRTFCTHSCVNVRRVKRSRKKCTFQPTTLERSTNTTSPPKCSSSTDKKCAKVSFSGPSFRPRSNCTSTATVTIRFCSRPKDRMDCGQRQVTRFRGSGITPSRNRVFFILMFNTFPRPEFPSSPRGFRPARWRIITRGHLK